MKTKLLLLAALVLTVTAGVMLAPKKATCAWCPTYKCFGPCGYECLCMANDYSGGSCVSLQNSSELKKQGWHEVTGD